MKYLFITLLLCSIGCSSGVKTEPAVSTSERDSHSQNKGESDKSRFMVIYAPSDNYDIIKNFYQMMKKKEKEDKE